MQTVRAALAGSVPTRERDLDESESALNALIERRAANREHADEEPTEESWKANVAEYHEDRDALLRRLWAVYYRKLARSHARLSEANAAKAAALMETNGKETS